jgi:hypothetical protein
MSLKLYAELFFDWDRCPHIRRLKDEKNNISKNYAYIQRRVMKKHIFKDPIIDKKMKDITRADIIDFRSRIKEKGLSGSLNKIVGILKIIFKEALFREDIHRDPTSQIGIVKHEQTEAGIFTNEELTQTLH